MAENWHSGDFVAASNSDEDKAVPVEVTLVVWVHRQAWSGEYGLDINDDFEDCVKDWVKEECQEMVDSDNWSNVKEVTN